jgi:hypothetical protein
VHARSVALVLSVVLVLTAGGANVAVAQEPPATTDWLQLADQAAAEVASSYPFVERAGQNIRVWWISPVAWYAAEKWGWQDPRTVAWLDRMYARQNASGGYGIGEPWDWGNNGTTNPASTSYTISTAWHVGRTLIDGYDAGGVPRERVLSAVTSLLNTSTTAQGRCISYSDHPNDAGKACVWNINATAAWFLWRAYQRGIVPPGRGEEMLRKFRTWRDFTRANYRWDLDAWTYSQDHAGRQDAWHNAATVAPMNELDPTIGVEALDGQFGTWPDNAANADLVLYDCARITPRLLTNARAHAFVPYSTQRQRVDTRSRWAYMALRVHRTCSG